MADPKGTIKLIDGKWHAFTEGEHFESYGIGEAAELLCSALPYKDVHWELIEGQNALRATKDTGQKKLSKKDQ